jgi:glycosyltransferase involved in cell wall biosynthesis
MTVPPVYPGGQALERPDCPAGLAANRAGDYKSNSDSRQPVEEPILSAPPRRILFLMHEALFFVTHRLPLGVAARDMGFEVHVAAPAEDAYVDVIRRHGFHYHDIPLDRGSLRPVAEVMLLLAFRRLIRSVRPDLIHAVGMKPVCYGGSLARLLDVPAMVLAITGLGYLFTRRGTVTRGVRQVVKALFRFALGHQNARAIFQNPDDLVLFKGLHLIDPAIAVMIKGCGVDMTEFAASPEPDGEITVMFPARLIGDKGVREFVEAAELLKRFGVRARFVLVGRDDPQNPTNVGVEEIAHWLDRGAVELWGFQSDMPATLAKAHIVCMPSYREGLPRGLIEAAACARPIVTANVPGCREIVRDGENGLLVPARDSPATAAALRRLIEDGEERRRMGARAREIATAEFTVDQFVDDHVATYQAVLEKIPAA